ncbi:MAG: TetR/AcrR family transcriptional regulator [Alistipes sp.]|nr:TetR/AcrR family transcriptional regulator [Alistipes sp.]
MIVDKQEKITITQIARKANIDRKTFYLHYTCTEDIIKDFAMDKIGELKEMLVKENFSKESFSILRFFELLNQIVERHLDIFHFISLNRAYAYFFDQLKEMLIDIIAELYHGFFDFSETKLRLYADFYIAGIISVYMRWIHENYPISMQELAQLTSDASFGGLKNLLRHTL